VNGARDQLFACAGFSLNKNRRIGGRNLLNLLEHCFQSSAVAYNLFESARTPILIDESQCCDSGHENLLMYPTERFY
jgi:hypothetical protein